MPQSTFSSINSIIERDKVDTPYKYSLLRAVIESCQEFPQFAKQGEGEFAGRVVLPVGLLVFKWLIYYYPFFEGEFVVLKIGERPGHRELAFRRRFEELTAFYADRGGFSVFYDDLVSGSVPGEIMPVFASLVNKIRGTIVDNPMRHLGYSQTGREYAVFSEVERGRAVRASMRVDVSLLIDLCGSYALSQELYAVFRDLGGFILVVCVCDAGEPGPGDFGGEGDGAFVSGAGVGAECDGCGPGVPGVCRRGGSAVRVVRAGGFAGGACGGSYAAVCGVEV